MDFNDILANQPASYAVGSSSLKLITRRLLDTNTLRNKVGSGLDQLTDISTEVEEGER